MTSPLSASPAAAARQQWLGRLFPGGPPRLWCPPLTHYTASGAIDRDRIAAHLKFISPWVKGLLVPGSTGDGWELTTPETRRVLEIAVEEGRRLQLTVLAGALRPEAAEARKVITQTMEFLRETSGSPTNEEAWSKTGVCGFAVCPPRGRNMPPAAMEAALSDLLSLGLPMAIYQLPQVTENEMSPELLSSLARCFGNFLLFKDTSGTDTVALSGQSLDGVFMVRGAEGGYARWLKTGGGVYDGFLLSTANAFARPLHEIIDCLASGRTAEAAAISDNLSALVAKLFEIVRPVPDGNAFANSGKAADHFQAHGPGALGKPPPRLHSGRYLPEEVLRAAGEALTLHGLMPAKGYLD